LRFFESTQERHNNPKERGIRCRTRMASPIANEA
jgi:hypothetical protein